MTLHALLDAVVAALQGGTTTYLSQSRVYVGLPAAVRNARCIAVYPVEGVEEAQTITASAAFADNHTIHVEITCPEKDPDGVTAAGDWFGEFLDLAEEVKRVLRANRRIADADGETAYKARLAGWEFGIDQEQHDPPRTMVCRFTVEWQVAQDSA